MQKPELSRPILIRYTIAIIGAALITIALLLFMNDLVNRFILRDPVKYFAITNFIPSPDRGRQLPDAPPRPVAAPDTPEFDYEDSEAMVLDLPVVEVDTALPTAERPLIVEE